MNLYGFAGGDPVNFSDPFGLSADCNYATGAGCSDGYKRLLAQDKPLEDPGLGDPVALAAGGLVGAPARMAAGGAAKGAGAALRVLGHHPEYLQVAEGIGAKAFNVPAGIWNSMSKAAQWGANQKFLDRGISAGAEFVMATRRSEIRAGSTLMREVNYLLDRGYQWTANGMSMIPK